MLNSTHNGKPPVVKKTTTTKSYSSRNSRIVPGRNRPQSLTNEEIQRSFFQHFQRTRASSSSTSLHRSFVPQKFFASGTTVNPSFQPSSRGSTIPTNSLDLDRLVQPRSYSCPLPQPMTSILDSPSRSLNLSTPLPLSPSQAQPEPQPNRGKRSSSASASSHASPAVTPSATTPASEGQNSLGSSILSLSAVAIDPADAELTTVQQQRQQEQQQQSTVDLSLSVSESISASDVAMTAASAAQHDLLCPNREPVEVCSMLKGETSCVNPQNLSKHSSAIVECNPNSSPTTPKFPNVTTEDTPTDPTSTTEAMIVEEKAVAVLPTESTLDILQSSLPHPHSSFANLSRHSAANEAEKQATSTLVVEVKSFHASPVVNSPPRAVSTVNLSSSKPKQSSAHNATPPSNGPVSNPAASGLTTTALEQQQGSPARSCQPQALHFNHSHEVNGEVAETEPNQGVAEEGSRQGSFLARELSLAASPAGSRLVVPSAPTAFPRQQSSFYFPSERDLTVNMTGFSQLLELPTPGKGDNNPTTSAPLETQPTTGDQRNGCVLACPHCGGHLPSVSTATTTSTSTTTTQDASTDTTDLIVATHVEASVNTDVVSVHVAGGQYDHKRPPPPPPLESRPLNKEYRSSGGNKKRSSSSTSSSSSSSNSNDDRNKKTSAAKRTRHGSM